MIGTYHKIEYLESAGYGTAIYVIIYADNWDDLLLVLA